jgi:hypothetical protein
MATNSFGTISGYVPLFNISTFDSSDTINANQVIVNTDLELPYVSPYRILETDANSKVVGQALTTGQVLVGSTAVAPIAKTLTAGNSVTVSNNPTTVVFDTIQDIRTSATPTFNDLTLTNLIANQLVFTDSNKNLSNMTLGVNGQLVIGSSSSSGPVASTIGAGNNIIVTNGQGSISVATSLTPSFTWVSTPQLMNTGTLTLPTSSDTLVGRSTIDTLTNKTLTTPTLNGPVITNLVISNATLLDCYSNRLINSGTLLLPTISDTLVSRTSTDTLTNKTLTTPTISSIVNTGLLSLPAGSDTLVGRSTTDTLTNKTLTTPTILSFRGVTGLLTAPTGTDVLVGRDTSDTLTNKTLTTPTITSIYNSGLMTLPTGGPDTIVARTTSDTLTNKVLTTPTILSFRGITGLLTTPTGTDVLVGRDTSDTLTNKVLTTPTLLSFRGVTGLLTSPTGTDVLVGRATVDTLTNKKLTAPTLTSVPFLSMRDRLSSFDMDIQLLSTFTQNRLLVLNTYDANRSFDIRGDLNMGGAIITGGSFTVSGANAVTLASTASTNVTLPTTGTLATLAGTESLSGKSITFQNGATALNYYFEGTASYSFAGITTANITGTLTFTRIGRHITLTIPAGLGTSNSTNAQASATITWPTGCTPLATTEYYANVIVATTGTQGNLSLTTTQLIFAASSAFAGFGTGGGNRGWNRTVITYVV